MMTEQDYQAINAKLAEEGWQRVSFDGGQSHLMGWTIESVWQKDDAKITLNHSERYNEVSFEISASPKGVAWIKQQGWAHVFED
ncbi:hypothetical protein [Thiomicrospira sp.]|uniref:hypothetical protein n=1 Tax=Thiomicrospira sp. TaxID=935 RepID=UPI0025E9B1AF|nr:hypothetical protein [Thiomicrospira sp.]